MPRKTDSNLRSRSVHEELLREFNRCDVLLIYFPALADKARQSKLRYLCYVRRNQYLQFLLLSMNQTRMSKTEMQYPMNSRMLFSYRV